LTHLLALVVPLTSSSAAYTLKADLSSDNFFQNFNFFSEPDPTHGFVRYQDSTAAIQQGLAGLIDEHIYLGVDYTHKDPAGRASVRMESKPSFNTGLLIADIAHMPTNECGTWPAFWMLGPDWPNGGEIDILENVNDSPDNAVTLHTSTGCVVDNATTVQSNMSVQQTEFAGTMVTDDCDVEAAGQSKNAGCSIKAPSTLVNSYGADFNADGGGVYALEWTAEYIQVFFFPRFVLANSSNSSSSPLSSTPNPSSWGKPLARFSGSGCDFTEKFKDLRIVFNTAFCGEWAGNPEVWKQSCAQKTEYETCAEHVREHPEAFTEAYWEIKGLKWFSQDSKAQKKRSRQL
jgi:hypothetical protein